MLDKWKLRGAALGMYVVALFEGLVRGEAAGRNYLPTAALLVFLSVCLRDDAPEVPRGK